MGIIHKMCFYAEVVQKGRKKAAFRKFINTIGSHHDQFNHVIALCSTYVLTALTALNGAEGPAPLP